MLHKGIALCLSCSIAIGLYLFGTLGGNPNLWYMGAGVILGSSLGAGLMCYIHTQRQNSIHSEYEKELFLSAYRSLSDGYYLLDLRRGSEEISAKFRELFSLPMNATKFVHLADYLPSETFALLHYYYQSYQKTPLDPKLARVFTLSPNASRHIECHVDYVLTPQGKLLYFIFWFKDISKAHFLQERLRIENDYLISEVKKFSTLLNTLPFPIWVRNADLRITYCNVAYAQIAEERAEHLDSRHFPELDSKSLQLAKKVQTSGKAASEKRHLIVNSQRLFHYIEELPVSEAETFIGYCHNIHAIELLKREVQSYATSQANLLECSANAMAIFSNDMRIHSFNQSFLKLWDLEEQWLERMQPSYGQILDLLREKRLLPEQVNFQHFRQRQLRLFHNLEEPYNEFFHLPDGRTLRLLAIPYVMGGVLFSFEDITDRLALERSHNMLIAVQQATIDHLQEGVAVLGENGKLKLYNPVYAKLWGYDAETLANGPHFSDLLEKAKLLYNHGGHWEEVKHNILAMLSSRVLVKERLERTDGVVIDRLCIPLPDGAILLSYLDVTDSITMERSLRHRNQLLQAESSLKSAFLSTITRDLQSPLSNVIRLTEAMREYFYESLSERQQNYVDSLYATSQQLSYFMDDMLELSSIESRRFSLHNKPFDLYRLLTEIRQSLAERFQFIDLDVQIECSPTIGAMVGDADYVKQLIKLTALQIISTLPSHSTFILWAMSSEEDILITAEPSPYTHIDSDQPWLFEPMMYLSQQHQSSHHHLGLPIGLLRHFFDHHAAKLEVKTYEDGRKCVTCRFKRDVNTLKSSGPKYISYY